MMMRYRVRIPAWALHLFPGSTGRESAEFVIKADAQRWKRGILEKIDRARLQKQKEKSGIPKDLEEITLDDASAGWLSSLEAAGLSAATRRSEKHGLSHILRLAGGTRLSDWHLQAWDEFAATRRAEGASDDALFRERRLIQAIAAWARKRAYAVNAQVVDIPRVRVTPTVERRYDPAAIDQALGRLTTEDRQIAEFLAMTGLRAGELRNARVEWILWASDCIEIPHTARSRSKGRKPRRLALHQRLRSLLRQLIGDRAEGPLFQAQVMRSASTKFNARPLVKRLKALGVIPQGNRNGIHDLRHHFLSELGAGGADLPTLQQAAGHAPSSVAITAKYMHAAPEHLDRQRKAARQGRLRMLVGPKVGPNENTEEALEDAEGAGKGIAGGERGI